VVLHSNGAGLALKKGVWQEIIEAVMISMASDMGVRYCDPPKKKSPENPTTEQNKCRIIPD
jgi:hypothetical protein